MASSSSSFDVAGCDPAAGFAGAPRTRIEPVAFDGHFGALHLPASAPSRGVAVLICAPVGRDARCAYRPLFLLAQALAARCFPVLRYDHLGGGDSLPLDAEADQWPFWGAGVERAAAFARTHTGCARLVLLGLRIGASLAALAAPAVKPDGLVLLAPIASGKAWIRELQMAAAMVGLDPPADGSVEIDGLRLSRATVASVQGVALRPAEAAVPTLLATPAPDPRLAARLGPAVTTAPFDGYAELFKEAHLNAPPEAVFDAVGAWLEEFAADAPAPAVSQAPRPAPPRLVAGDWTERPVVLGDGLRGILCLPTRPAGGRAVIFGNTGGDPRAGIAGFATRACRELAARGVAALRFDFAGLGESDSPGAWRPHVYETSRTADLAAAADLLARRGYGEPTVAGVCAGGYHALRAAIDEPRFRRVMAINSWLVWRPHDPLELKRVMVPQRRRINVLALMRPSGWRRLLSGEVRAGAALATLFGRIRRLCDVSPPDSTGRAARAEIARIAREGAKILVLVGRDDESVEGLETDFGFRGRWLARRPGVAVTALRGLDHGLFSIESQDKALAELFRFVGVEAGPARRPTRGRRQPRLQPVANSQPAV